MVSVSDVDNKLDRIGKKIKSKVTIIIGIFIQKYE